MLFQCTDCCGYGESVNVSTKDEVSEQSQAFEFSSVLWHCYSKISHLQNNCSVPKACLSFCEILKRKKRKLVKSFLHLWLPLGYCIRVVKFSLYFQKGCRVVWSTWLHACMYVCLSSRKPRVQNSRNFLFIHLLHVAMAHFFSDSNALYYLFYFDIVFHVEITSQIVTEFGCGDEQWVTNDVIMFVFLHLWIVLPRGKVCCAQLPCG